MNGSVHDHHDDGRDWHDNCVDRDCRNDGCYYDHHHIDLMVVVFLVTCSMNWSIESKLEIKHKLSTRCICFTTVSRLVMSPT
jgi:hypothetical protein